jgi:hypothetical protein
MSGADVGKRKRELNGILRHEKGKESFWKRATDMKLWRCWIRTGRDCIDEKRFRAALVGQEERDTQKCDAVQRKATINRRKISRRKIRNLTGLDLKTDFPVDAWKGLQLSNSCSKHCLWIPLKILWALMPLPAREWLLISMSRADEMEPSLERKRE